MENYKPYLDNHQSFKYDAAACGYYFNNYFISDQELEKMSVGSFGELLKSIKEKEKYKVFGDIAALKYQGEQTAKLSNYSFRDHAIKHDYVFTSEVKVHEDKVVCSVITSQIFTVFSFSRKKMSREKIRAFFQKRNINKINCPYYDYILLLAGSDSIAQRARNIPGVQNVVKHPKTGREGCLYDVIMSLNDHSKWSFDEIADWIESLDEIPEFTEMKKDEEITEMVFKTRLS